MESISRPLTARQQEVLDFIRTRVHASHRPPTVREIGEHFEIRSTNGVRVILDALEKKGQLKRSPRLSRGLSVIEAEGSLPVSPTETNEVEFVRIPVLGRVAAGSPILAVETAEETLTFPRSLVPSSDAFALRVQGNSMQEAGILDGDLVFARPQVSAHKGETIIALVGDEATVKEFYPEADRIRLQPRNASISPIWVDRNSPEFRILGRVVGVFRQMR